jgi:hypothetical protein
LLNPKTLLHYGAMAPVALGDCRRTLILPHRPARMSENFFSELITTGNHFINKFSELINRLY